MFDDTTREIYIHYLDKKLSKSKLPSKFNFPFYYNPDPWSVEAAHEVMTYLTQNTSLDHNFGLESNKEGVIGKMFGVMIVKTLEDEIGYIAAYSGKLAESNFIPGFAPPIFDTLDPNGFYKIGERKINEITRQIETLEQDEDMAIAKYSLQDAIQKCEKSIEKFKQVARDEKKKRNKIRAEQKKILDEKIFAELLEELKNESLYYHFKLRDIKREKEVKIAELKQKYLTLEQPLKELKARRKELSHHLQKTLHQKYRFFNAHGEQKDLLDIFGQAGEGVPPAGSGECAAPKLFQYAYSYNLKPISMAEFWWGEPPPSAVRRHKEFYPACRSKCEPILGHMLKGLDVEENPLLAYDEVPDKLEILYEDDYIVAINKPAEFLSVPGKIIKDSVLTRLRRLYPDAQGALLLHRLDMSTSGILVAAKQEDIHKHMQRQFMQRTINKEYTAILDGHIETASGFIDLPLRVDLDNRPRQLVCYEHGKSSRTKYSVLDVSNGKTRVKFIPITGRTHQLRVHAAHQAGLNVPILGDDLYGKKGDRLYLHACKLSFIHPYSKETISIVSAAPF